MFTKYVLIFRSKIRIAHFVSMSAYIRGWFLPEFSDPIVTEYDHREGTVVILAGPDQAFQFAPISRKHP